MTLRQRNGWLRAKRLRWAEDRYADLCYERNKWGWSFTPSEKRRHAERIEKAARKLAALGGEV